MVDKYNMGCASFASQGVKWPDREAARVAQRAAALWPHEACGLLLAPLADPRRPETLAGPLRAVRCRNRHPRPEQGYELHPRDFLRWDRRAAARGLGIVGVWHSHPCGAARPSATDHERAWRGWIYLIVAVEPPAGEPGQRAWRWSADGVTEVSLDGTGSSFD